MDTEKELIEKLVREVVEEIKNGGKKTFIVKFEESKPMVYDAFDHNGNPRPVYLTP